MRRTTSERAWGIWTASVLGAAGLIGLTGCGAQPTTSGPRAESRSTAHDHADHAGHDHGAGEHPHEGPHHGHLIELGKGKFHAELTHDDATQKVTVFLLDGQAKGGVTSDDPEITFNLIADGEPLQVKLAAEPQEGDAAGTSSRYSIVDEKLHEALESAKTTGRLSVRIAGKPLSGSVVHHEHGEHTHE